MQSPSAATASHAAHTSSSSTPFFGVTESRPCLCGQQWRQRARPGSQRGCTPQPLAGEALSGQDRRTMKLGLFLPLAGDATRLREMITVAASVGESAGFHSLWFAEHVALFDTPGSRYPYSADRSFPLTGEVGIVEPFVAIAFAAALTTRIRLGTGICLVPQRAPLYTAKQVADADVLSGGRLDFGIGIGWLREEFEALGVPFAGRAARCREYLAAMRSLWTDPVSRYEGPLLRVPPLRMFPKPVQKPHPPIVFGARATRRSAASPTSGRAGTGSGSCPRRPRHGSPPSTACSRDAGARRRRSR